MIRNNLARVYSHLMSLFFKDPWKKEAILKSRYPEIHHKWWSKNIFFKKFNLQLNKGEHYSLISGYEYALALHEQLNGQFSLRNENLYLTLKGIKVQIKRGVELYILHEIFILQDYHFSSLHDYIVIDIGMNVGFASLFFAQQNHIQKIYAYEPIDKIYQEAISNFELNPKLKEKIIAHQVGLGKNNETVELFFNDTHIGNTTKNKENAKGENINAIQVEIRNAQEIILEISKRHDKENIFIKIDCEGMEFDIFESFQEPIPKNVTSFILEWHFKKPISIIRVLEKNNFICINHPKNETLGMLYAFREPFSQ